MRNVLVIILMTVVVAVCLVSSALADQPEVRPVEWYADNYAHMRHLRQHYTFESEFTWPEEFQRVDSSSLTGFQFWVSNLPLWYANKGVSSRRHREWGPNEIARPVHLPWRTPRFYDYAIPVNLYWEYHLSKDIRSEFALAPRFGDSLKYEPFLSGRANTWRGRELRYEPGEKRKSSEDEENAFADLISRWFDIPTLIANADPVGADSLLPGDLIIATDSTGRSGRVWVTLVTLVNGDGNRLYAIATGCPERPCDFHLPKFNEDRNSPWIPFGRIEELTTDFAESGYYRLRNQ